MELFEGGIARGITLAPVNTAADVLLLEQLAARDYWDEVKLPSGRTLRAAGAFVKASRTPVAWTRPAPDVGEHTSEIARRRRSRRQPGAGRPRADPRRRRAPPARSKG